VRRCTELRADTVEFYDTARELIAEARRSGGLHIVAKQTSAR
jgi:hypothetical protein